MDERDRDGTLADRRRDSLEVAAAHLSHCEDARTIRFEEMRLPRKDKRGNRTQEVDGSSPTR